MDEEHRAELNVRILAAHEACDPYALAELYAEAADLKSAEGQSEAAAFLRTQAFVFALESAHPLAGQLRALLARDGRELSE